MMQSFSSRPRVLIVDDEPLILSSYERALRNMDAEIVVAEGPRQALDELKNKPIDVVISDYRMPEMNGDEFLEIVRQKWPETVRLLNTAYADVQTVENTIRRGAIFRLLTKPGDIDKMRESIQEALEERGRLLARLSQSEKMQLDLQSFKRLFHSALDPMMIADLDGHLMEVNEAFANRLGCNRQEAILRRPTILSGWREETSWANIKAILNKDGHWANEVNNPSEDRYALLTISVVKDDAGAPYALAAIEKDISARWHLDRETRAAQYEVILTLAKLAEYRDPETGAHLERLRRYSEALTRKLSGMPKYLGVIDKSYVEAIFASSPLHDIGKVGVPDAILLKPGKLTDEEWPVMKSHAQIGAEVLAVAGKTLTQKSWLALARTIALQHHEKFDGSGYPNGLCGEDIDISARIVALADAYDAITAKRVYKAALSHDVARERILEAKGKHFDPDVVDAFLEAQEDFIKIKDCTDWDETSGEPG